MMKINLIPVLLVIINLHSFGQISFEKGYFINNNNQRIECLIKNTDWKNNPSEFEYRLSANGISEKGSLSTVKEFGITDFSRFVRADVKIDISPSELDNLSKERDPVWLQERIFVKVLVEGKAKLYYYEKEKLKRYFYSVSDTSIIQLIYKQYYVGNDHIAENFKFREQLWNNVRCANAGLNSVENLRYTRNELEQYIKKYNEGKGQQTAVYSDKKKRDSFHIRLTPGLNYSGVSVSNGDIPYLYTDFGSLINFRIGAEAEFILPFNKNKWGIIVEPSYQFFNSSGQNGSGTIEINYQSIEFPSGIRYSFFLNNKLKIFVNAFFIPATSIDFNSTISNLEIKTWISTAFGSGIGYKKLSAEVRYYTNRELLIKYLYWDTDYRRLSLILGYRIF
jgi:hypothetical protein